MTRTRIEWCDETWNPVTGCTKVSGGCRNCFADRMAKRLKGMGARGYENGFAVTCHPERLAKIPRGKGKKIFVCDMGDLFHDAVPDNFIIRVFKAMARNSETIYMILTKRPERMKKMLAMPSIIRGKAGRDVWCDFDPTNKQRHIWLGVSVEDQKTADERITLLLQTPAAVHFVSAEPMLGIMNIRKYLQNGGCDFGECSIPRARSLSLNPRSGLNWVICGGESGPGARPMHPDWARSLRDQCDEAGVPFFFKQWGEWQNGSSKGCNRELIVLSDGAAYTNKQVAEKKVSEEHIGSTGSWGADLNPMTMARVGKKTSGRLLDGKLRSEFPEVR